MATATKTQSKKTLEDTITLEMSVRQARIIRAILGRNNGLTTSSVYFALTSVLGDTTAMEDTLERSLPELNIYGILGE